MAIRRRSRLAILLAIVVTLVIYKGTQSNTFTPKQFESTITTSQTTHQQPVAQQDAYAHAHAYDHAHAHTSSNDIPKQDSQPGLRPIPPPPAHPRPQPAVVPAVPKKDTLNGLEIPTLKDSNLHVASKIDLALPDDDVHGYQPKPGSPPGTLPEAIQDLHAQAPGRNAGGLPGAVVDKETPKEHWRPVSEHFPVLTESIIPLPTGSPKAIPKIQFDFKPETAAEKELRETRLAEIKGEMLHTWNGYQKYAWMHDEVAPNTKTFKDPFCGWAATLVDALDTLWIMGLKDEFDEAAKAVADIDFTYSAVRADIPVFETTIRYLGGLLSAYDVSGGKKGDYPILLEKAVELATILMGIFDTPNRMPILYYQWAPEAASQPHRAGRVGIAELGSLAIEFTRLAQVTGENKYYDAIARITNELEGLQDRGTAIPGLFPEQIDASGCNRTATMERNKLAAQQNTEKPVGFVPGHVKREEEKESKALGKRIPPKWPGANAPGAHHQSRPSADIWDCVPQPIVPATSSGQSYSIGGSQDSTYEYFPKQHLLLGGLEPQYEKLYLATAKGVKKDLMYRPMTNSSIPLLFTAKVQTLGNDNTDHRYEYELTHLTCFIGGMFGMASKIFNLPDDLEIAKQMTDTCVWAYGATSSGIMPESAQVMHCPTLEPCAWNETAWHEKLDTNVDWRNNMVAKWEGKKADFLEKYSKFTINPVKGRDVTVEDLPPDLQYEFVRTVGTKPMSHQEWIADKLSKDPYPPSFIAMSSKRYILRPEAIESVWYMYRITGDPIWMEKGWKMWKAVVSATKTEIGHSALESVLDSHPEQIDGMESFWLAETLKYFYLLFAGSETISLDEWVLNTEAHPFRRPTGSFGRGEDAVKVKPFTGVTE